MDGCTLVGGSRVDDTVDGGWDDVRTMDTRLNDRRVVDSGLRA